ncbi:MAG TPA: UDP-3-O-acyl-N-acetylglucosamine deacetylase [Abditibacteriaceae bacterium]|nr:UDP-3-O-acyl-N-acetylglucosamine deacetylase [Abditibacteriaceae bacterium]
MKTNEARPCQTLPFQTLQRAVQISGIGLHSGVMVTARLCPRHQPGVVFVRSDLPAAPEIPAALRCVTSTQHATTLTAGGAAVSTVEHLLAALWAMNVTNCRVELEGPEVPILDGSATGWCCLVEEAGIVVSPDVSSAHDVASTQARPMYRLRDPVWVTDGKGSVLGLPHDALRVTVAVDYGISYVGRQTFDLVVSPSSFAAELAPARTFTLEAWVEPLRAQGLIRGGSIENAIVLGEDGPSAQWSLEREPARHKALDVVGDVALLFGEDGGALQAHLIAICAGHGLHRRWMEECARRGTLIAC